MTYCVTLTKPFDNSIQLLLMKPVLCARLGAQANGPMEIEPDFLIFYVVSAGNNRLRK